MWRLLFFLACFLLGYLFRRHQERRITRNHQSDFTTYAKKEFNRHNEPNH